MEYLLLEKCNWYYEEHPGKIQYVARDDEQMEILKS